MSFLGDLYESIGSDKAPPPPVVLKAAVSGNLNRPSTGLSKAVAKPRINGSALQQNGTKRKADATTHDNTANGVRPSPASVTKARQATSHPDGLPRAALSSNGAPKTLPLYSGTSKTPLNNDDTLTSKPSLVATRAPPKNFQEILARAKQAQAERPSSQIGMIKHQPVSKEKTSRLAERKRDDEEKLKHRESKPQPSSRPGSSGQVEKRRSASPTKRQATARVRAKEAKTATPVPVPNYRGTMGLNARRSKPTSSRSQDDVRSARRTSGYDDYLATDEEDEGEMVDEEEPDEYASDASSDMEAGAHDVYEEETLAERAARAEDAREHEQELKLKREKEERRKKLQAMASRSVRRY